MNHGWVRIERTRRLNSAGLIESCVTSGRNKLLSANMIIKFGRRATGGAGLGPRSGGGCILDEPSVCLGGGRGAGEVAPDGHVSGGREVWPCQGSAVIPSR